MNWILEFNFNFAHQNIIKMNAFFYAIADLFNAFFPILKALGGIVNVFFMLVITIGVFGWTYWVIKHPDVAEKLD
jgi:hypothetical protein